MNFGEVEGWSRFFNLEGQRMIYWVAIRAKYGFNLFSVTVVVQKSSKIFAYNFVLNLFRAFQ